MEIRNDRVKLMLVRQNGALRETYFAKHGNGWRQILESGSALRSEPSLKRDGKLAAISFQDASVSMHAKEEQVAHLDAVTGRHVLCKVITLRQGEPFARIQISYRIEVRTKLQHLLSTYSFAPVGRPYADYKPLDFIFSPQLRPEPDHVIADHTFRSPALILQKDRSFAALVPDVRTIDVKTRALRATADLQIESTEKPFFSFGLQNWAPESYRLRNTHVYYASTDTLAPAVQDTTVSFGFLLFIRADAPPQQGFQEIVRYHWNATGAGNMQRANGPQAEPFAVYVKKAWYEFLPQIALDVVYQDKPVTLLRQARLAWSNKLHKSADNDAWFNVWFNSLRTAYGMFLHGKDVGDEKLKDQATQVLNLALLAPQTEGIAPSIFYVDSAGGHWVADHAWGGISNGEFLPMFHNAWTNYWLLQWMELAPNRREDILKHARSFGDFLLKHQSKNGVIPSWYHPETLEPAEALRDENGETAGAALFLAELSKHTSESKYLEAAELSMKYIFRNIVPYRKWFDFETFFSCSRKPLGFFDSFTQQHPQNTLSMHQAAEACYELYKMTKNPIYKEKGIEIMDYLCLFQQVWSPSWLSCELFGGFGVQNTDAEWSDSRQGYFAVTLMNYYEMTGRREYFERGIAALRAMFSLFESPTSPRTAENYAHSGHDQLAGVTGIHWGTGSSVVSIHLITQRYGDAYVNVKEQWGVGIDGCRIPRVAVKGSSIDVEILDNFSSPRTINVRFDKLSRPAYNIRVNGKSFGTVSARALKEGIGVGL